MTKNKQNEIFTDSSLQLNNVTDSQNESEQLNETINPDDMGFDGKEGIDDESN